MATQPKSPNTILGDVHWSIDMHFGTMQYVCDGMLGLQDVKDADPNFLNTDVHPVDELREFFWDRELSDGRLAFDVFTDTTYQQTILCRIETTVPYKTKLTDQDVLNLVADFKEHVRKLPRAIYGDGRLILDPNDPNYHTEANQAWLDSVRKWNEAFSTVFAEGRERLRSEGIDIVESSIADDDILF